MTAYRKDSADITYRGISLTVRGAVIDTSEGIEFYPDTIEIGEGITNAYPLLRDSEAGEEITRLASEQLQDDWNRRRQARLAA